MSTYESLLAMLKMNCLCTAGALGDKEEKDEKKGDVPEEEDPEILEAKREAEEKRNEKYRKMEEERETMRQGIRDKVREICMRAYPSSLRLDALEIAANPLTTFLGVKLPPEPNFSLLFWNRLV